MTNDIPALLAAAALARATGPVADNLAHLWITTTLASRYGDIPISVGAAVSTAVIKEHLATDVRVLRLARTSRQILEVLPQAKHLTQDVTREAIEHLAYDKDVEAHIQPRLKDWKTFTKPRTAEASAAAWAGHRSRINGGTSLTNHGLVLAMAGDQTPAALRQWLGSPDVLHTATRSGVWQSLVQLPVVTPHTAHAIGSAVTAGVFADVAKNRRTAISRAISKDHTQNPGHVAQVNIADLLTCDDPAARVRQVTIPAFDGARDDRSHDAWRTSWAYTAAQVLLDSPGFGADPAAWEHLFTAIRVHRDITLADLTATEQPAAA
jgi:hypothetical protein